MSDLTPEQKLRKHDELINKLDRTTCGLKKDMTVLKELSHSTSDNVAMILREILGNEQFRADGIVHKQERMQQLLDDLNTRIPKDLDYRLEEMDNIKNILKDIGKWGSIVTSIVFFIGGVLYSLITRWDQIVSFFTKMSSNQ